MKDKGRPARIGVVHNRCNATGSGSLPQFKSLPYFYQYALWSLDVILAVPNREDYRKERIVLLSTLTRADTQYKICTASAKENDSGSNQF